MTPVRILCLVSFLSAFSACTRLKPGYCESNSDCASGDLCNLEWPDKYRCSSVVVDAGDGSAADSFDGGPADSVDAGGVDAVNAVDASDTGAGCRGSQECPTDHPICVSSACVGCGAANAEACGQRDPSHPVCGSNGTCFECSTSADCSRDVTKPICNTATNTCGPCMSDSDCMSKGVGPGVCMAHQDGRCASDGETIYVENRMPGCVAASPGGGTASAPYCNLTGGLGGIDALHRVLVVKGTVAGSPGAIQASSGVNGEISIIGLTSQSSPSITFGATMTPIVVVDGAAVYLRNLNVSSGDNIGILARNGAMLRLDGVNINKDAQGGLLIDGAAFDIRNSTLTSNGPGDAMGTAWGGVRVQGAATLVPRLFTNVTISSNKQVGLSCTAAVTGAGVLAGLNVSGVDISPTCGIIPCTTPGPDCGAP